MSLVVMTALFAFHIPAGDGSVTLPQWARQAHIINARIEKYGAGLPWNEHWPRTNAIDCTLCTARSALCTMLTGTGYRMLLTQNWPPTYVPMRVGQPVTPGGSATTCDAPEPNGQTLFDINIPAESLFQALSDLDRQTQHHFLGIDSANLLPTRVRTQPLVGQFTVVQAVCKLLSQGDGVRWDAALVGRAIKISLPPVLADPDTVDSLLLSAGGDLRYRDLDCMEHVTEDYAIPAQPLENALTEYSRKSHLQMLFDNSAVAALHLTSSPLQGRMTLGTAGQRLLAGAPIKLIMIDQRTVAARVEPPEIPTKALMVTPPQPKPARKAVSPEAPNLHDCICAQSRAGIPLGPWCWAGEEMQHDPTCPRTNAEHKTVL